MIKLNTNIGRHNIQIEFNSMKDLHKFGAVYGNLPKKCDACGSDNLFLSHKSPKGNDYYILECGECRAAANFGIHNNEPKSLYWKREKMERFVAKGQNGAAMQSRDIEQQNMQNAQQTFDATPADKKMPF